MSIRCGIPLIDAAYSNSNSNNTAIVDAQGEHSYESLFERSGQVAQALLAAVNQQGQTQSSDLNEARVAFLIPSGFEYVIAQWGIWRAGGITVPLCTAHPQPELEYVIDNAQVDIVITHPEFSQRLESIIEARPDLVSLDITAIPSEPEAAVELPIIDPLRRAMIVYTSGTTSRPKGAVTTHANIGAQVSCLVSAWEWSQEDSTLHVLPLHHVHGIVNVLCCALAVGAKLDMLAKFDAEEVWQRFIERHYTLFMAVPTIYVKLAKIYDAATAEQQKAMSAACAGMRLMVSGSAALPVTVLEKWRSMTGHTFLERYGMTEIGMALSNPYRDERRPGYVGVPLPGVQIKLVDEQGETIAKDGRVIEGLAGEIYVKGPNVFLEYWNKPEVTAESFSDGWFKTGDQAIVEAGYYRILGRNSVDVIKSGGYKVFALEIEEVLRAHPDIEECCVVGIDDEEWGELVAAAIILRAGSSLTEATLSSWAREKMATYKIPKLLCFIDELPRNVMGKVTKPAVKALFA